MAKDAISELSACPVTPTDAVVNLSVLSIPVLPDPPRWMPAPSAPLKWSSVPSAPPWWSSAPRWGSSAPSAHLWWSSAPPWCSSAPPAPPPFCSLLLLLLSLQVLHLHSDLALHPSPCFASTPPPSWTSVTLWGVSSSRGHSSVGDSISQKFQSRNYGEIGFALGGLFKLHSHTHTWLGLFPGLWSFAACPDHL